MPHRFSPARAWAELLDGNGRFVRGDMKHPAQGVRHRGRLATEQNPFAVVFGCSDSRVPAEIIFDRGLGDLFVVRTAGHTVDTTVIGSIEYGVDVLRTPLVIVLGHESCGAVGAASDALETGRMPGGFVRAIVDRVIPSIVTLPQDDGVPDATGSEQSVPIPTREVLGREHVRHTVRMLQNYSTSLSAAVVDGRCAIVGLTYTLSDGRVHLVESAGSIDIQPS